jgi:hypothetical protein
MHVIKSSLLALLTLLCTGSTVHAATPLAEQIRTTLESVCTDCHDAETRKGGLDLSALAFQPENPANRNTWIQVYDRVKNREMPPKSATLEDAARSAFLKALAAPLTEAASPEPSTNNRSATSSSCLTSNCATCSQKTAKNTCSPVPPKPSKCRAFR